MKLLTKQEIVSVQDLRYEDVLVPEWGEDVGVRIASMTGAQREEFEYLIQQRMVGDALKDSRGLRGELLSRTLVGAGGAPLFTPEDIDALMAKNCAVVDRLFKTARTVNGIGDDELEKIRKN